MRRVTRSLLEQYVLDSSERIQLLGLSRLNAAITESTYRTVSSVRTGQNTSLASVRHHDQRISYLS